MTSFHTLYELLGLGGIMQKSFQRVMSYEIAGEHLAML